MLGAGGAIDRLIGQQWLEGCDEDERTVRRTLATEWVGVGLVTPCWGLIYIAYGELAAGLIPVVYGGVTAASFAAHHRWGGWEWFRVSQLVAHLLLPFFLMWLLGGFGPGSAVLIWALLAPLSSIWAGRSREALVVVAGFLALTVFSALINSRLSGTNDLPEWLITAFFAGNFVVMTTVIFLLLVYFTRQQADALAAMRRNRELESAYLQQEVTLRQSEKLATMGKLSAGLAHELNNPAAAAQQATRELAGSLVGEDQLRSELARLDLSGDAAATLSALASRIAEQVDHPEFIDPLDRSDREAELQDLLARHGVEDGWELAPALVSLGLEPENLERLRTSLPADQFGDAVALLTRQTRRQSLLGSLGESTARIVSMVGALQSYTHLDRAPRQLIDVHEGLDSTLAMLQSRLKSGIEVRRNYSPDLPRIEADVGELNQVWTNILDNAIDAMASHGLITLTTREDGEGIVVELEDDGPGVPPEIAGNVFDPFVTSKAPGDGTGLGLNISHRIVTEDHNGEITLSSEPGRTVFAVRLPVPGPGNHDGDPVQMAQAG